jgi:Na+:H+ antiporter, NhaB family
MNDHGHGHDSLSHRTGPNWFRLFMGHSPTWYKFAILCCLVINPIVLGVMSMTIPGKTAPVSTLVWDEHSGPRKGKSVALEVDGVLETWPVIGVHPHGHALEVQFQLPDGHAKPEKVVRPGLHGADPITLEIADYDAEYTISGGIKDARFIVGWLLLAEFIFTLAMALACYPLLPGGLLCLEGLLMGLATVDGMYTEALHNFPVILLLVFVVAGVNFLKEWLSVVFTGILFSTRSKIALSLMFSVAGAVLSAFLDALTVTAVIIAVCKGFWDVYHSFRSQTGDHDEAELEQFRGFLRSLVMHAVIGTALGGVCTMVGEPQNLLISHLMVSKLPSEFAEDWSFVGFFIHMAVVTMPTLVVGLLTCVACEKFKIMGYGQTMPENVRTALQARADEEKAARRGIDRTRLGMQTALALLLVAGLGFHWAEVGILGLFLIVLATTLTGINDEHRIGQAFTESLPFTTLLVVFFGIVAIIAEQDLFRPVISLALGYEAKGQQIAFFLANAALSSISDNVFVATVFINEATAAFQADKLTPEQYEKLAIAINTGTNIPSVATPNGQAALLFLLTSAIAAPIRLGYVTMLKMALPYTITMTTISLLMVWFFL